MQCFICKLLIMECFICKLLIMQCFKCKLLIIVMQCFVCKLIFYLVFVIDQWLRPLLLPTVTCVAAAYLLPLCELILNWVT